MSKKLIVTIGLVLGLSIGLASVASAGIPFRPFSTCTVSIVQLPTRPNCINNFTPDVVRLCPSAIAPVFDSVTFNVTILDALAAPVTNALISVYELSGVVNIATGGATTASTNTLGKASVTVSQGGGCGQIGVCADGVLICEVNVRSPDIANTGLPSVAGCTLPTTGSTFVNSNDKGNTSCGFNVKFGPVTAGTNDCWDLNCDNLVNSTDTGGGFVAGFGVSGGWLQHFGHSGALGAKSTCP
jgi:hypothetical protein